MDRPCLIPLFWLAATLGTTSCTSLKFRNDDIHLRGTLSGDSCTFALAGKGAEDIAGTYFAAANVFVVMQSRRSTTVVTCGDIQFFSSPSTTLANTPATYEIVPPNKNLSAYIGFKLRFYPTMAGWPRAGCPMIEGFKGSLVLDSLVRPRAFGSFAVSAKRRDCPIF